MVNLTRDGAVFLLDLGDGDNRFNPNSLDEIAAALDEVEVADGPKGLVTTATGKIWSNGLDLDWMGAHLDEVGPFLARVERLYARLLTFPAPTAAAIQGHCFAAGAIFALAHDWQVMRVDRGFWCLPEVDLGFQFPPGMSALIQARLSAPAALEAMTTGRRYGGADAVAAGLVTSAVAEDEVLPAATARVAQLTDKASANLGRIKQRMFAGFVDLLGTGTSIE